MLRKNFFTPKAPDTAAATFLVQSIAGLIAEWFFKESNR